MLRHRLCVQATFAKGLRTSAVIQKQPARDRQRRRRKMPPPFHSLPFYDEDPLKTLKIEHLFPTSIPGSWGTTNVRTTEKFYKIGRALKVQPTLFEKLKELYYHERNLWYHRLDLPLNCTNTLDFSQYITRTNVRSLKELTPTYSAPTNLDINIIKNRVQEFLTLCPLQPNSSSKERQEFLGSFMECIYSVLVEYCDQSHLRTRATQADVGAKVETFFKRSGFADLYDTERIKNECLSEGVWEATEDAILDAEELLRFRICGKLAWQIRTDSPLPPFVAASEGVCFEDRLPPDGKLYRPEVFGLDPIDHYDFSCLPFVNSMYSPEYIRSVAGYWPSSPFLPEPVSEEPCKFGLLGVVDVTPSSEQWHFHCTDGIAPSDSLAREALSNGILAAFAWTSAMAYNQGFTLYNELESPFSVQLLLFDATSATWQLIAYQLNSLCALWKAPDAGDPFNLLWNSPRIPMFTSPASTDLASSHEHRPNSEALELVTRAMLLEPTQVKAEANAQVRLIPNSSTEGKEADVTARSTDDGAAELTEAEHAALFAVESEEAALKSHPIRAFPHPRPHPNEVFFLKLTEKAELLEEMREKMPAFGGALSPFYEEGSAVPADIREALRQFRLDRRARTPHSKVLRRPPRWR
ncbi:hypothetical protein ECG_03285 [Echinococcus granulosus]|uniref:Ribosomal protein S30 mitochondrial n=1 Tax=Echinococcus granulosus TaxID=6210 RepID=U6JK92_ECHGR|nr:hypothetical protein EGR_05220 [Echinococcus granulosus]EUB59894.1 hypothetical protein EGR_05220 [Echinococcus granulosus]KAH9284737.1 hypothetical protein ECG_03285 [Echinococcus granulosus]CDS24465.1 Ribosomal protein S30 mitochondrial [Echinococcus granulosus]